MTGYLTLKLVHILSATVLFGTGLGTAFAMWRANRDGKVAVIATVARNVVLADWLFTTPAVIVQPLTGWLLMRETDVSFAETWIVASVVLYGIAGTCWLPVVWLQIRVRDLAAQADTTGGELPALYDRYMRLWFALGWPAFGAVIAIFALMVFKPA